MSRTGGVRKGGGAASQRGSILASHPAVLGSILGVPKNFSHDVAYIDLLMALLRT